MSRIRLSFVSESKRKVCDAQFRLNPIKRKALFYVTWSGSLDLMVCAASPMTVSHIIVICDNAFIAPHQVLVNDSRMKIWSIKLFAIDTCGPQIPSTMFFYSISYRWLKTVFWAMFISGEWHIPHSFKNGNEQTISIIADCCWVSLALVKQLHRQHYELCLEQIMGSLQKLKCVFTASQSWTDCIIMGRGYDDD